MHVSGVIGILSCVRGTAVRGWQGSGWQRRGEGKRPGESRGGEIDIWCGELVGERKYI